MGSQGPAAPDLVGRAGAEVKRSAAMVQYMFFGPEDAPKSWFEEGSLFRGIDVKEPVLAGQPIVAP